MSDRTSDDVIRIGCDGCVMVTTNACSDCLVTYLCSSHTSTSGTSDATANTLEQSAVVLHLDEFRAIRSLQRAGLVPQNRHRALEHGALEHRAP